MEWKENYGILRKTFVEAVVIGVVTSALAIGVNAVRPHNGIALVAKVPYETVVPCPDLVGEVESVAPQAVHGANRFVVDAREAEDFEQWHVPGAVRVTYDYLTPIPASTLQSLTRDITAARPAQVIVYGDGEVPDSGEQLARDIAHHGIRNVYFVTGGAPAIRALRETGGAR